MGIRVASKNSSRRTGAGFGYTAFLLVVILAASTGAFIFYFLHSSDAYSLRDAPVFSKNISSGNRTHTITTIEDVHLGPEELFDLENVPTYMRDYFDWHRRQLQQMKEDAKEYGEENDDYLLKYRFLVLRCADSKRNGGKDVVEDRCGGLSDRIKPFPLYLWYAATTSRILFFRWGRNRPAAIETFMVPGHIWNWTFPDELMRKIEFLEANNSVNSNDRGNFTHLYFDERYRQHKKMVDKLEDQSVWMIESNDYTGGSTRYESLVKAAINTTSASTLPHSLSRSDMFSIAKLHPRDAFYENFYHDLFHATFRPSSGVEKYLNAYFYDPKMTKNTGSSMISRSWLPVPLQRNHYVVAHYRAKYPKEPYRVTKNRTILRETTIHAVECAKSRVSSSRLPMSPNNVTHASTLSTDISAVYVASDTALVMEAVRDTYHNENTNPFDRDTVSTSFMNVWTYLDLQSYDTDTNGEESNTDSSNAKTKHTITLAEDPPHLNFAQRDDLSAFYVIFVDLFLMSYANCVVYGAGGFGRLGSLVSYRPSCGMAYSVHHGVLKHCDPYD